MWAEYHIKIDEALTDFYNEDDYILDPLMGSGATGIAAKN